MKIPRTIAELPTVPKRPKRPGRPENPTIKVTPVAKDTVPMSALRTEFGKVLETVMTVPGVLGVVLCDSGGYAIDYVFNARRTSAIDVQIIGAQLGQPLERLFATTSRHGLPQAVLLAEAAERSLLCATVAKEYVVAAMLADEANVALALRRFEAARARLSTLLEG